MVDEAPATTPAARCSYIIVAEATAEDVGYIWPRIRLAWSAYPMTEEVAATLPFGPTGSPMFATTDDVAATDPAAGRRTEATATAVDTPLIGAVVPGTAYPAVPITLDSAATDPANPWTMVAIALAPEPDVTATDALTIRVLTKSPHIPNDCDTEPATPLDMTLAEPVTEDVALTRPLAAGFASYLIVTERYVGVPSRERGVRYRYLPATTVGSVIDVVVAPVVVTDRSLVNRNVDATCGDVLACMLNDADVPPMM